MFSLCNPFLIFYFFVLNYFVILEVMLWYYMSRVRVRLGAKQEF